jgi:beta-mannosidase
MARARMLGARSAQPLGGSWQVAALAPAPAATPADLDDLRPSWIDCDGPMPAAAALRAAGRWDVDRPRDFDAEDWWYRCRFSCAQIGEPVRLRFDGLATVVDVWLNGRCILHSESMFATHSVDVEHGFAPDNELFLHVQALAPLLASHKSRPRWRTRMVSHQALRWYRTTLLGRCPGWCPPVAPVGPWRPIEIEPRTPLAIVGAHVHAELDEDDDGIVRLRLEAACPAGSIVEARLVVDGCESTLTCETRADGHTTIAGDVQVIRPERWWPHTHGSPAVYSVGATIVVDGRAETVDLGRVGFRRIAVDRGADGESFGLVVNGSPVFCRGVCWTPLDVATLSATSAEYRVALECLRDGGTNMIRLSGTMTYEADAFYDLCDELGILLFHDFMFANMDYPWEDERFAGAVLTEAAQVLARLQSRPALAVLCASSEVEQQAAMLGLPARRPSHFLDEQLPNLVRTMAPAAIWLPGTPCGGAFPFQVNSGVSHYYGVGAYQRPFDDARRAGVRFSAECLAFSNVPDIATVDVLMTDDDAPGVSPRWKARVPRDAGVGWDFEDVRDHYVQRLFGVHPDQVRAADPDRYLALGRIATGEAMLRTFAEWRRPGSTCRGGLVWFGRDLWPGAGWGIVDSSGRPKAAYWYLKRALAPVALLPADEGLNGLWFHVINDTPEPIEAELHVAVYRDGSKYGAPVCTPVIVPGRGDRSIHADALFDGFRDLTGAYKFGQAGHDVIAATLRDAGTATVRAAISYVPGTLPVDRVSDLGLSARAEPERDGYLLVVETSKFAHAVALELDGWIPDDNYFHVEPGESKRVSLRSVQAGAALRGSVSALNGRSPLSFAITEAVDARR